MSIYKKIAKFVVFVVPDLFSSALLVFGFMELIYPGGWILPNYKAHQFVAWMLLITGVLLSLAIIYFNKRKKNKME